MPYVIKDANDKILAFYDEQNALSTMWVDDDDLALKAFFAQIKASTAKPVTKESEAMASLETSDLELIRVIEDLTELLIKKQVFVFTELPLFAQQKLGKRQKIRNDMVSLNSLLSDEGDEGIF